MSLIEEALRRVQEPLGPAAASKPKLVPKPAATQSIPPLPPTTPFAPTGPSPRTPQQPATSLPRSTNLSLVVVIAVLMLAAGLIGGGVVWIGRTVGAVRRTSTSVPNAENMTTPVAAETAVPPTGQESFILNGIVEGVGEPYAVINGVIVGIGDHVGDATLMDVHNGSATLQRANGKRSILRVPR